MAVDIYWSVSLMKIIYYIIPVIAGWILDLIIGDPHCIYHPVRLIGWLIGKLDKMLREELLWKRTLTKPLTGQWQLGWGKKKS